MSSAAEKLVNKFILRTDGRLLNWSQTLIIGSEIFVDNRCFV